VNALRLTMGAAAGKDRLDGGWWPHSRDLSIELADLVGNFPSQYGRILRATCSAPDWDDAPRRIAVHGRAVKVGRFRRDESHVIRLTTSGRAVYCLLVIPSTFDEAQGSEALLASATHGNRHSATELLRAVTNELPVDPAGQWAAGGQ